jgi:CheY-like chemotaxis protein
MEDRGFLVRSVEERLKSASYHVIEVHMDTDEIHAVKEPLSGILINADEELVVQQKSMNFLKDLAISDDIPIFVIGGPRDIDLVKAIIPDYLIRMEFTRPVHVTSMVVALDKFIQQFRMKVKKKILAVDDSGAMLRTVKGWLEDKYQMTLANSGTMAIKCLALNRPDLILLDYEMPVCDGKQVLEMIRTEMDFADIPVMFLTHKDDRESIMKVKEWNPEGYLLKSYAPSQIIKEIDDFFFMQKAKI